MKRKLPWAVMRLLHIWFRMSRGLTLGVRGAVIDAKGRVLLVRHTYTGGWHMPGGGVEPGESLLAALCRELGEEAEITVSAPPVLHGIFHNTHATKRDHVVVFVVRHFAQLRPKVPDREIAETGFFPLDRLPDHTTRGTRARLAEIGEGLPPSHAW